MMKKLFILFVLMVPMLTKAQSKEQVAKFQQEMDSKYFTVDGVNIVVAKIVDSIPGTKDEIYARVKAYFARTYADSKSVIQTDDEKGGLVIGKGIYGKLKQWHQDLGMWFVTASAYHVLRVDIKEGRARIICNSNEMNEYGVGSASTYNLTYNIVDYAPFTTKKATYNFQGSKSAQCDAFFNLVDQMHISVDELAESVKNGGTLKAEKDDW